MRTLLAWLLLATGLVAMAAAAPAPELPALELVALANEGFLLRVGEQAVIVDGLIAEPYSIYEALPASARDALMNGAVPYDDVVLALASHVHADHFQAEATLRFLDSHPHARFLGTPQSVQACRAHGSASPETLLRTQAVFPESEQIITADHAGVRVEFLRLRHGGERFADIQNLGMIIHIGGFRALHIGDADIDPALFAPYSLAERDIDVALLPYWFFQSQRGQELVDAHLKGRVTVACHIPPDERSGLLHSFAQDRADIILMNGPLDARLLTRFEGEHRGHFPEDTLMALEMRAVCERCNQALSPQGEAFICTYECTFCAKCSAEMKHVCPNCSGELVTRPKRKAENP